MKKSFTLGFLLFSVAFIFAQPANDNCNTATIVTPNGSCNNGTTVGAGDSWQGSVGCQGGGNHPDVWYTFTATGSQAQLTVTTSGPWSGNVELILVEGTCAGGFTIEGSQCGPSPLNASFTGLVSGTTYYYTVSNANGGTPGPFQTCVTTSSPPTTAGQDCNNAAILCNSNTFSQSTSNAGFGSQEVSATNSCWLTGGERQSKWFKFTAGCSGTLEFNINPINGNDDYDWALWNITSDPGGCTTKGNSIACNWSGCRGSTGISSCVTSEPGVQSCPLASGGDPCGGGNIPRAWGNWSAPGGGASTCLSSTVTLVAGNVYTLLVDNFTASNSGFSLSFGGACGGGTARIGPDANFTYTPGACGTYNFTKTCPTSNSTFLWQFGDGATATTQNASHTYSTFGNFVITLQVTDALGCVATYSQTVNIASAPLPTVSSPVIYCMGDAALPLAALGTNLLWYTTSTGGVGSSTAPTPSTATAGTTSYYVSQTIGGCESARAQIDVIVNASVTPTFNPVAPICPGATLSPLPTSSLNGITGTWSPALDNTATTTYTFTPTAGQCATTASLTITVNSSVTPTFNAVAPICSGATLTPLPTTSLNGITGTWSPALDNTATTTYTFTPTAGQCATTASLTITVNSSVTPTFNAVAPICSGGTLTPLPTTSLNGITGAWSPALDNTATTTYTFTPTAGQCATTASLTITVNSSVTPTFNAVAPICSGATLSPLPTTSLNGITGAWSPALDNTATTTYTFTPTAGQCATIASLTITVNASVTPTFNALGPVCSGAMLPPLPTTSINGITGTWSPALNNTATTTYTFTPTAGQCATTASLTITVNSGITPTFNALAPICSGATLSPLPTTSLNGVTGVWSPALNNTATTTYTFTPSAGQCATAASLTITVNSSLTPTFNPVAPICSGATLSPLPLTSLNGITGTWSPALNNTVTTTYTFTPTAGQCATTASLTITVNPVLSPTINCGISTTSSVTFNWGGVSGATGYNVSYQINGGAPVNVGAIGNVLLYQVSGLSGGDNVTITVTPTGGTCFTASSISCTAISCVPPTANISYASPFCSNISTAQTVTLTGTGTFTGGVYSTSPGLTLNSTTGAIIPATSVPGTYTVTYTVAPSGGCPGVVATTSVTINSVTPSVSITANTTSICTGGSVVFTATPTNGGASPIYQWKINGLNVAGQTSSTFTTTTLNNGDIVTVTMTSSDPCADPITATSNAITITTTTLVPSVSIVSSTTSICTGGSVTFTATPTNGGAAPTYQWKINGANVAGQTSSTFTTTTLNNGDVVTVTMTSNDPCANPLTATSNAITVTTTTVVPAVSIASNTTSICSGGSVTFTATPTNGGSTPTYQWKINGANVAGQTSSTFTTTTLNNGDIVTATMSSSDPCANPLTATSNAITVTTTAVVPSVSIVSSTTSICTGGSVTFTATPTNGGATPTYQWKINGVNVAGQTSSTFTTTTLNNGDIVTVTMTSTDPCANPLTATSNAITVTTTAVVPSVLIAANTTSICTGGSVTFTATPTNGGATPTYQWKINGVNVAGQTSSTFTTTTLNNGDIVTVTMTSSDPCANPVTATGNAITVTTATVVPSVSIGASTTSLCTGGSVTFTATPTNGGTTPTYQWKINGVNVSGQTASTFTTTTLNNGDIVTVTMTSTDPCANPVTATSNAITITTTTVAPSVSIASNTTSICTGSSVTFTATATNGGTTPTYQWKINGVNVSGQTASTFTTTTLNNGDIVTVTMTSTDPCANPVTATSNAITVTATTVVPSVSIASNTTSICTGSSVTFTATPTNGGTTPTYQWKINGVNVAGQTSSNFTTTTLNNGDIVTVLMNSTDPCANPTNAVSNTIPVVVNTSPVLNITAPPIVCTPSTVDLTAPGITSGSSGGSTYSYWGDAAGTIPVSNPNSIAASGTYYIRSQSAGGCFTIKPVTVTIENKIPGIRYPDVSIAANTPLALQARSPQPNCTYQWNPNRGLNSYTSRDVVFSFGQRTEYFITITSPAGCVTVDTQLVNITVTESGIFVPKAWTPNGDGHNDFLFPLTANITKINYFRVFNRWGELVFETNLPNTGWNGIYKGKAQPIEVYTWRAEGVTITGEIIRRSGNSVLIR